MFTKNKTYAVIFWSAFLAILFFVPTPTVLADNTLPPKIISISPNIIDPMGTRVEITGENFGTNRGSSRILTSDNREQSIHSWSDTKIISDVGQFLDPRNFSLTVERMQEPDISPVKSNAFSLKILPWGPPRITSITRKIVTSQGTEAWIHGENFGMPGNYDVSLSNARVYETNGTSHKIVLREHDVIRVLVNLDDLKRTGGSTFFYVKVKCLDDECSGAVDGPDGKDYVSNSFAVDVADIPPPLCTADTWSCGNWNTCLSSGSQTRTCGKTTNCQGGVSSPATSQSCTYVTPVPSCTSFSYSSWSQCTPDGKQTRNVTYKYPYNCEGGESKTIQSCTYIPPAPTCDADTWTCGDWNSCSLSGVQNRSCRKTFDCPSVETAPPTTDQYCETPNRPAQQIPQNSFDEISNQDTIIKATVKLYCLYENGSGVQGSGTVIDPSGTILTNKHVVDKTLGCLVEFVDNFNDTPNYDIRQIADIQKVSSNEDIAILKLRNPQNKK